MEITVLFFGVSKELAGVRQLQLTIPNEIKVAELRPLLQPFIPGILDEDVYRIAVNEAYSEETDVVSPGDTIAIIPPVSGG